MTAALRTGSPLRLPLCAANTAATLSPDGLRGRLEELTRRGFSGRVELQADDWTAELLFRDGRPVAAALGGPGLARPLAGQAAVDALLQQAVAWRCRLEVLDEPVLAALVGVGAAPHERVANGVDELRDELRTLSTSGQNGVLEVSLDRRWARVLVTEGELLGAYSDAVRAVEPSLGELAALLGGEPPRLLWFSAEAAQTLTLPTESQSSGAGPSAVERQVIWIVSRFEGDWGRARERGELVEELQEALAAMLDSLQLLAAELEAAGTGGETLEEAVGRLASGASEPRALEQLDQRLSGLGPQRACAVLVELVGDALRRVVRACPEPQLAEFCRQTAVALDGELRATLSARPDAHVSRSGAMPR